MLLACATRLINFRLNRELFQHISDLIPNRCACLGQLCLHPRWCKFVHRTRAGRILIKMTIFKARPTWCLFAPESTAGSWQSLGHRGAGCRHRCLYPSCNSWGARCSWHSGTLCPGQTCGLSWTWVFWHFSQSVSQGTWLASPKLTWLVLHCGFGKP